MKHLFIVDKDHSRRHSLWVCLEGIDSMEVFQFDSVERSLNNRQLAPDIIVIVDPIEFGRLELVVAQYRQLNPGLRIVVLPEPQDMRSFMQATLLSVDAIFTADETCGWKVREFVEQPVLMGQPSEPKQEDTSITKESDHKQRKKVIYILEDDKYTARLLQKVLLDSRAGSVKIFNDARSFFDAFAKTPPDYVVLDYYLDGELDGGEALKRIKRENQNTQVIIYSNQTSIEIAKQLIMDGAKNYLYKSTDGILRLVEFICQTKLSKQLR